MLGGVMPRCRHLVLGLLLIGQPAVAADEVAWRGVYAGLEAGLSYSEVNWRNAPDRGSVFFDNGADADALLSGFVGFRSPLVENWVGGVELAFIPNLGEGGSTPCAAREDSTCSGRLRDAYALSGLVGQSFTDRFLGYFKVGVTSAEVKTLSMGDPGTVLRDLTTSEREIGLNVGLGAEYRVADRILLGAAYTYHRFDAGTVQVEPSPPSTAVRTPDDPQAHVVGVRLSFELW